MSRIALITGGTGQDGGYLAKLLLERGYEVHGLPARRAKTDLETLIRMMVNADIKPRNGITTDAFLRMVAPGGC